MCAIACVFEMAEFAYDGKGSVVGLCLELWSSNRPIVCYVFRAEAAHSSWQAGGILRTCVWPVSCVVGQLFVSPYPCCGSSTVFHRVSVLVVCCAAQGMGEYMEAHDRLATGLASWCLCSGRPYVLLPCVGLGSFACPAVMYLCAMVGPSRCCLCACLCRRRRLGRDCNRSECTCIVPTNASALH